MSHPTPDDPHHPGGPAPGAGKLLLLILVFIVVGIPVVAIVWDALNQIFAGHVNGRLLLTGLAGLGVLGGLLALLGRALMRLEHH